MSSDKKRLSMEIVVVIGGDREARLAKATSLVSEGYTLVDADRLQSDKLARYIVYARTQGKKPVVVVTAGSRIAAEAIYGTLAEAIVQPVRIIEVGK